MAIIEDVSPKADSRVFLINSRFFAGLFLVFGSSDEIENKLERRRERNTEVTQHFGTGGIFL